MALPAIVATNVSKMYRMYARPSDRLKEMAWIGRRAFHHQFWALRDISFEVARGQTLGVIGPNGSGKSTLLEILTGILQPTTGRVRTSGRVAALLDLGAGFNPEFTGRENLFMNGEIMGLGRRHIERNFERIADFAEIGEFMDQPMKTYSTGMWVRLAFAAAIHVDPEVLVVDEALAVGDAIFANRCVQKFRELKARGVTVVLVSHDLALVKVICDRAMLLYEGRSHAEGDPGDVVNRYNALVLDRQRAFAAAAAGAGRQSAPEGAGGLRWSLRHGDRQAEVLQVELYGEESHPTGAFCAAPPRPRGGDDDPHARGHGGIRHQHHAGAGLVRRGRRGRAGRRAGGEFHFRLLARPAGIHADCGHPVARRLQPRLAGRRAFLPGDRLASHGRRRQPARTSNGQAHSGRRAGVNPHRSLIPLSGTARFGLASPSEPRASASGFVGPRGGEVA